MAGILLKNISTLLSLAPAAVKQGRRVVEADLGISSKQTLVIEKGKIVWIGPARSLPARFGRRQALKEFDMKGMTVLPGYVESHTHTLFTGNRAAEFEMRNQGVSYQEIAAQGGGDFVHHETNPKNFTAANCH